MEFLNFYVWFTQKLLFCIFETPLMWHYETYFGIALLFSFYSVLFKRFGNSRKKVHLKNNASGFCCGGCFVSSLCWQSSGVFQLISLSPNFICVKRHIKDEMPGTGNLLDHHPMVVGKEYMKLFSIIQQTYVHNLIAQLRFKTYSQMLTVISFRL